MALDFLKKRAATHDHPLDVAEQYQLHEGFDDLGDACRALVESLEALDKERGARMTVGELENLRRLTDALREPSVPAQRPEPGGEEEAWREGLARPLSARAEAASGAPPCSAPAEVPPGLGPQPAPEAGGARPGSSKEAWVPKRRATSLTQVGPDPQLPQVRAELGRGSPPGRLGLDPTAVAVRRPQVAFERDDWGPSEKTHRAAGALGDPGGGGNEKIASFLADIAHSMDIGNKRAEEASTGKIGTLQSITKDHELLVICARGCGRFRVAVCGEEVGRSLVKALLRVAEHSAALFKHHRWPTLINYRIAYGLATGAWGGKSVDAMHAHSLGVADWVTCAEELFDDYLPPSEFKIEGRPKQPVDMLRWAKQARNGIQVTCLTYGEEHREEREEALEHLIHLHENRPRKFTAEYVQDAWEELHARWWEELRWQVKKVQR